MGKAKTITNMVEGVLCILHCCIDNCSPSTSLTTLSTAFIRAVAKTEIAACLLSRIHTPLPAAAATKCTPYSFVTINFGIYASLCVALFSILRILKNAIFSLDVLALNVFDGKRKRPQNVGYSDIVADMCAA